MRFVTIGWVYLFAYQNLVCTSMYLHIKTDSFKIKNDCQVSQNHAYQRPLCAYLKISSNIYVQYTKKSRFS